MNKSHSLALTLVLTSSVVFAACQSPSTTQTQSERQGQVTPVKTATPTTTTGTTTTTAAKTVQVNTSYESDGGTENVAFKISVDKQGVITDAQTSVLSTDSIGIMRQTKFAQALPGVIVGKKLADLTAIDRVAGSSLTTNAFNDALAQLKAQL